jgi:hypothetical protein
MCAVNSNNGTHAPETGKPAKLYIIFFWIIDNQKLNLIVEYYNLPLMKWETKYQLEIEVDDGFNQTSLELLAAFKSDALLKKQLITLRKRFLWIF